MNKFLSELEFHLTILCYKLNVCLVPVQSPETSLFLCRMSCPFPFYFSLIREEFLFCSSCSRFFIQRSVKLVIQLNFLDNVNNLCIDLHERFVTVDYTTYLFSSICCGIPCQRTVCRHRSCCAVGLECSVNSAV